MPKKVIGNRIKNYHTMRLSKINHPTKIATKTKYWEILLKDPEQEIRTETRGGVMVDCSSTTAYCATETNLYVGFDNPKETKPWLNHESLSLIISTI